MGSIQPRSPLVHLVQPVHSHSHARDNVLPTFDLGKSVREPTVPVLCLPQLPDHHCLLSGLHICSRPSRYCWFQCYHCSTSHRIVLPATSSGTDDRTSDMSYFSYSNSSLTSTEKWLDPGPYPSTFSSITAHRSPTTRRTTALLSLLLTYDTDQYIWIFLVVVNSFPSRVPCVQFLLLFLHKILLFLHKILHCPNWKLK